MLEVLWEFFISAVSFVLHVLGIWTVVMLCEKHAEDELCRASISAMQPAIASPSATDARREIITSGTSLKGAI